jgi:DNA invertase Pin-like site-specific DNA recombinase
MKRAYERVSGKTQDTALQRRALTAAGCERFYSDTRPGADAPRPKFTKCLAELEAGDVLVVWKLDRAFRSFLHAMNTIEGLDQRGIKFQCLTQGEIDTSTALGRAMFRMASAFAEFERELIRERSLAGVKASSKPNGRPSKMTAARGILVRQQLDAGIPMTEIARLLGIDRDTIYRHRALWDINYAPTDGKLWEAILKSSIKELTN